MSWFDANEPNARKKWFALNLQNINFDITEKCDDWWWWVELFDKCHWCSDCQSAHVDGYLASPLDWRWIENKIQELFKSSEAVCLWLWIWNEKLEEIVLGLIYFEINNESKRIFLLLVTYHIEYLVWFPHMS